MLTPHQRGKCRRCAGQKLKIPKQGKTSMTSRKSSTTSTSRSVTFPKKQTDTCLAHDQHWPGSLIATGSPKTQHPVSSTTPTSGQQNKTTHSTLLISSQRLCVFQLRPCGLLIRCQNVPPITRRRVRCFHYV